MSNTVKEIRELTDKEEMTIRQLKSLRLSTIAEAYEQQILDPNSSIGSFEDSISSIVTAECDARRSKKINKIIAKANLMYSNAFIDDSIYAPDRQLNVELIQYLFNSMNQLGWTFERISFSLELRKQGRPGFAMLSWFKLLRSSSP